MWGDVLGLAFLVALNPMLLAFILLMLSRPRPGPNLLGYWVGCLIVNVPLWLGALLALHLVPSFESFALNIATPDPDSGVQPLKIGMGLFALLIASVIAVRVRMRQRKKQPALVGAGDDTSTPALDSNSSAAPPISPGGIKAAAGKIKAVFQRLMARATEAWESGAAWVSVLLGLGYVAPLSLVLLVNTIIVGSGAPMATQILAVLSFVFVMLMVLEMVILCYVVAPVRTQAVLEPLHSWAQAHSTRILIGLVTIAGLWQLLTGLGLM